MPLPMPPPSSQDPAPVSPQPPRFGRGRVRAGRADVLRAAVCDHRDGDGVLCQPGARDRDAGFGAHDHDRSGAERRLYPGADSRTTSASKARPCCSIASTASPSTCRAIPRSAPSRSPIRSTPARISCRRHEISAPAGPGDIVVVRLFYKWPLFVTGLGFNIANLSRQQAAVDRDRRVPERTLP